MLQDKLNNKKNQVIADETVDKSNKDENKLRISKKNIKIILSLLFVGVLGMAGGFYAGKEVGRTLPATHRNYSKSQVLATVGDVKITGDDLAKRMNPYFYYYGLKELSNEEVESQEVDNLNYMTNLEALYQAGVEDKIEVTNKEVNEDYTSTMSSIESKFNLTEKEFLNKFNLTKEYIKANLKKELIAKKYLEENSQVSEKEAKNYYNKNKEDFFKVRASHILISNRDKDGNELSDKEKEKNKKLAEKILKRAQKGESFDDLALEYSDDSYTSSKGGDLGYFGEGDMVDAFEKAAFSLKDNEIYNGVVETTYGYHIIKRTGGQYSSFDDEKDSLIEELTSNKQNLLLQDALKKYEVKVNI